jgi:hypothetical protein
MQCPNPRFKCLSKEFKLIRFFDGSDNIDSLSHSWYSCCVCGYHFNKWNCSLERLKEVFGDNYSLYL